MIVTEDSSMSAEVKNGPYEPATDECIERWRVQVEYGAKIVVGPILRSELGAILARLEAREVNLVRVRSVLKRVLDAEAYRDPDHSVREVLDKALRAEATQECPGESR